MHTDAIRAAIKVLKHIIALRSGDRSLHNVARTIHQLDLGVRRVAHGRRQIQCAGDLCVPLLLRLWRFVREERLLTMKHRAVWIDEGHLGDVATLRQNVLARVLTVPTGAHGAFAGSHGL